MHDQRGRRIIDCANVTVEYDTHEGKDAVLLVPFPAGGDSDEHSVLLTGSLDDVRAVLDTIAKLADDLDEEP
jgi:hypothetical protein